MSMLEILAELLSKPSVSVPFVGEALGGIGKNAAYDAANADRLGVPVFECGGLKRCASIDVLHRLGFSDEQLLKMLSEMLLKPRDAEEEPQAQVCVAAAKTTETVKTKTAAPAPKRGRARTHKAA